MKTAATTRLKVGRMAAMEWLTQSQTGFRQASRYLLTMRVAIVAMQLVTLAVTQAVAPSFYSTEALLLCLVYGVFTTLIWLWFRQRPPRHALTVTATLVFDLVLIGTWLLKTGGYTNPLTPALLLPIAFGILLVPLRHSIVLTGLTITAYAVEILWRSPVLPNETNSHLPDLYLLGMWVAFSLTAGILMLVVGSLARQIREQQAQLSETRESRLRDEQIIALGLSSATVAHRLGTPLNTMTLLVDEMRAEAPQLGDDLNMLEEQLQLCSGHLKQLSTAAMQVRTAQLETLTVQDWLARLRESATLLWPASRIGWEQPYPEARVAVDATLDQAVLNLVANALTASPEWVSIGAQVTGPDGVEIVVRDHGKGLDISEQGSPGDHVVKSERGLGVGLFLSNATIQRLGGALKAFTTDEGTTMIIELPQAGKVRRGE